MTSVRKLNIVLRIAARIDITHEMKTTVVIDYDSKRNPSLLIGIPKGAPVDTEGNSIEVANLDALLNGLIVQMRIVEGTGVSIAGLTHRVVDAIGKGVFDANLTIKKGCKEK